MSHQNELEPINCLTEFTDSVEPFTELVSFIIQNANEVFKVPPDFLKQVKVYQQQIATGQVKDSEVPMQNTYCQQINAKQFQKETKNNTNDALTMLYAHMMNMEDGEKKREFMEKFKESYPGTPIYIPNSINVARNPLTNSVDRLCPTTPTMNIDRLPSEHHLYDCDGTPFSEPISMSAKNERFLVSTPCNPIPFPQLESAQPAIVPKTPGSRMKLAIKRIRRRSAEIFKSKPPKIPTPERQEVNVPVFSRVKDVFRRNGRFSGINPLKIIKKSSSTPTLTRRKLSDSEANFSTDKNVIENYRNNESALFSGDRPFNRTLEDLLPPDGGPISFQFGVSANDVAVNFGFNDAPPEQIKSVGCRTPLIKKPLLLPDLKNNIRDSTLEKPLFCKNKDKLGRKDGGPMIVKTADSLLDITNMDCLNMDCLDSMKSLSLDEEEADKINLNEPSYTKFKERRSYRKSINIHSNKQIVTKDGA